MKNYNHAHAALTLAAFVILAAPAFAGSADDPSRFFWGRVVQVQDGDTITVVRANDSLDMVVIRLYGIDAPEAGQDFGRRAATELRRRVNKKIVQVEIMQKADRYGRIVGIVKHEGRDVSRDMLESGLAWVYPQFCKRKDPCRGYWAAVRRAEKAGDGLWSRREPVKPWEWRRE